VNDRVGEQKNYFTAAVGNRGFKSDLSGIRQWQSRLNFNELSCVIGASDMSCHIATCRNGHRDRSAYGDLSHDRAKNRFSMQWDKPGVGLTKI
jgi:hypothetical protein